MSNAKLPQNNEWFYLDPDYRRDAPKSGKFCIRCQKPIGMTDRFVEVVFDQENMKVRLAKKGENTGDLIGYACWDNLRWNDKNYKA